MRAIPVRGERETRFLMAPERGDLRTAAVGLLGAMIGGLLSIGAVVYSEHAEADREEDRQERMAEASAHLLVDEYRSAGLYFERCIQTGKLWPVPPDASVRVGTEERKLIAAHIEPDAYGRASEAAANANLVLRALRVADRPRAPYPLLSDAEQTAIHTALDEINEGREALRPLTGESPAVTPKPPLRRPQPGPPP